MLKIFFLSFSKKWLLSSGSGKKFLTSVNALTVLLFRDGKVGTWLGLTHVNTEGGSLGLSLP